MEDIVEATLGFLCLIFLIFWLSSDYDVSGFQKELPFLKIEEVTSDDRDRVRRISELKQEKLALMREIEEEQRKRQAAEDESQEANVERRDSNKICTRRENDWFKEKDELKAEIEEERNYRRRCEDERLKL